MGEDRHTWRGAAATGIANGACLNLTLAMGDAMRAKLFSDGRIQAVRLPAAFRFEGKEVEVHRDPESGAVVLTPVRPWARAFLEMRDALLQEPCFREELDAFFEGLHDTSSVEPVDFP